jgi:virginiamycin B lyase
MSAIVLLASVGRSATITGTVKGVDGAPFQGAFVQAQNTKTKITVNVLSDSKGRYRIEQLSAGEYRVQIRAIGFTAAPRTGVNLTADQNASFDFTLQTGMIRWSDLSVYQGKQIFPPGRGKDILFSDSCSVCHSFQSRMASVTRDAEGWSDRVQYMRTSMSYILASRVNDRDAADLSTYLTNLFGPSSTLPKSPADMSGYKATLRPISKDALNIVYVEYEMPGPSRMPFSAAPDKNGNLWIPNFGAANKITRLDPKTGATQDFSVPNVGTASVHSAVPGPDGSVWLAEQASNKLGRWDPATQEITEYPDSPTGSKHTIRLDLSGNVWITGSPLTKFDPETKKFTRFEEVKDSYDVKQDENGDIWFTRWGGNKLGKVDGKTMKVTQWDSPTPGGGPRRLEIASDGVIWTDEYFAGKMARFDPKTQTFREYTLPGPDPTPYALGFDAEGYLWYDSNDTDVLGRFDTKTGEVTEYPFPHAEIYMREFFRDSEGRMWYGSNPNNKVGYFYLTKDQPKKHGSS